MAPSALYKFSVNGPRKLLDGQGAIAGARFASGEKVRRPTGNAVAALIKKIMETIKNADMAKVLPRRVSGKQQQKDQEKFVSDLNNNLEIKDGSMKKKKK